MRLLFAVAEQIRIIVLVVTEQTRGFDGVRCACDDIISKSRCYNVQEFLRLILRGLDVVGGCFFRTFLDSILDGVLRREDVRVFLRIGIGK